MTRAITIFTVTLLLLQLCCGSLWASPTTDNEAEKVVTGWLKTSAMPLGATLGLQVLRVETFNNEYDEPIYYIVYLQPSGFVIVPADDQIEPIIGFVEEGVYEPSLDNPLGALVINDIQERISGVRDANLATQGMLTTHAVEAKAKWDKLIGYSESYGILGLPSINDMRIAPLLQTKWGQRRCCEGTPSYLACYNYYTPESSHCNPMYLNWVPGDPTNYPCGCVATAMAQLMRYHQHPSAGIGQHDFLIWASDLWCEPNEIVTTRGGNGVGGPYDWANMVYQPGCSTPAVQRQAIGALCYDAGISVNMHYRFPSASSTADTLDAADSFVNLFGYSHAVRGYNGGSDIGAPLIDMLNPNLDAKHPVALGIHGSSGGHAVVCDGYGYNNSTLYHHLNMGWEGDDDAWYNLPIVDASYYFNIVRKCVYNVHPSSTGNGEVVSGRVFDPCGVLIPNPYVYAEPNGVPGLIEGVSDINGIYAITDLNSNTSYWIDAKVTGYAFPGDPNITQWIQTGTSTDDTIQCGNVWAFELHGEFLQVHSITPSEGPVGSWITIEGINFGTQPGSVHFANGDINVPAYQWSDNVICCEVPQGAGSGLVSIITAQSDLSTGLNFNVTDPNIIYVDGDGFIPCAMNGSDEYPFDSIQKGIDVSTNGDTIIVRDGTYTGTGNKNIDFGGKAITLKSENGPEVTIIHCQNSGRGFYFHSGEGIDSIVAGFTIRNGYVTGADFGGGIFCDNSSPTITNCKITQNYARLMGGGMYCGNSSSPRIINCTFFQNHLDDYTGYAGCGIACRSYSSPTITNCSFTGNSAPQYAGGLYCQTQCHPVLVNCIFWGNSAAYGSQITILEASSVNISYCDLHYGQSGIRKDGNSYITWGPGNINLNPLFVDDFHLEGIGSPCFNAGDPNYTAGPNETDIDGDERVIDDRVDMGADEVSECMNASAPEYDDWISFGEPNCWCYRRQCHGDTDNNKSLIFWVYSTDLALLKSCYMQPGPPPGCICADLDHQKQLVFRVYTNDLAILKSYYANPTVPCCDNDEDCVLDPNDKYNFWIPLP